MKLKKRPIAKMRKMGLHNIADLLGVHRATVSSWVCKESIPEWHVMNLYVSTGIEVK